MTRTRAEVRAFLDSKVGTTVVDKSDSELSGQCVALIKALMEFLGVPYPYAARGHAKDAGDNYIAQGIGTAGRGWLTICVNRNMGLGYGHIWVDLSNEANYEENGVRALVTTKNTRSVTQAQQFINFDKWITEEGDEPMVENNDAHRGRVGRIFKQTRGRYMGDGEFAQFVGKNYLQVNEVLGDNQEAFDNERNAEIGALARRDDWQKQIADRTNERDTALVENKELKAQLAVQSEDTKLLNGFGEFLRKLIARLGVK